MAAHFFDPAPDQRRAVLAIAPAPGSRIRRRLRWQPHLGRADRGAGREGECEPRSGAAGMTRPHAATDRKPVCVYLDAGARGRGPFLVPPCGTLVGWYRFS